MTDDEQKRDVPTDEQLAALRERFVFASMACHRIAQRAYNVRLSEGVDALAEHAAAANEYIAALEATLAETQRRLEKPF